MAAGLSIVDLPPYFSLGRPVFRFPISKFFYFSLFAFGFSFSFFVVSRSLYDFFAVADIACWCICFWWMHRISKRQDATLRQLQDQAHRIEGVSQAEHDILAELHPSVQKIEKDLGEVSEKVTPDEGQ